ncbi:hypothetical protein BCR35DRAFT_100155 [Leucosporidium creatinivorum]|uniref:F-box domain-containing protein n=1 Tax=Leucosporidium creatinivorum TaxID=106004 RepID=A0A1Y2F5X8_9BASI|nr:hypothetical protein BCR35DRAFT_100155 [Leucosporidium creatinivorum]
MRSPSRLWNCTILDLEVDMSRLSSKLLAGLKSLSIRGNLKGRPRIPPGTTSELTRFSLDPEYLPSLAFLDSILPAAPFLTSLELEVREDGDMLSRDYTKCLQTITQQLLHLAVTIGESSSTPTSRASLDVTRFVSSRTSLKSLELCDCGTAYIKDVVAALRAPLAVLETELAFGWNDAGTGVAELAAVLELPSMAGLKRWRMADSSDWGGELSEDETTQWEEVCRAHGVEPRDERRFFTDYPAE